MKPISKQQEMSRFKNGTEESLLDSLSVVEANGEKWVLVDARKTFIRTEKALTNMPLAYRIWRQIPRRITQIVRLTCLRNRLVLSSDEVMLQ